MNFQNLNYKIIGSTIAAIALGVIILILCFFIGTDSKTIALNIATLVLGISVGWLIGILISPYDMKEQDKFTSYGKALIAFSSGYLIAKADKLFEHLVSPDFLFAEISGFRIIAFLSGLTISIIITFVYREYAP